MIKNNLTKTLYNYYTMLLIISIVIFSLFYITSNFISKEYIYSEFWLIQFFILVITILGHLISSIGLNSKSGMHLFSMAGMSLRFFLSLIFIFISVFVLKLESVAYVLNFFILYFVYTSFEIYFLLRNLRPDSKKKVQ
ncbi:MAG: hypothetical protein EAZ07_07685 [Cytophagales bacterium]|nr:MAG: hypothetical protein EAZ07_07685 [Cytophagales bacterium]